MADFSVDIPSICSAIATALAAYAAWKAPKSAAKLAETLRREAERHNERQRLKLGILTTLMQERAQIYSVESTRALNLIDIVFNESREVREAWADLHLAFNMNPIQAHVTDERLRKLLQCIAKDVGLSDQLRIDDLGRVYYPSILAEEQTIRDFQRRQVLATLNNPGQPAQNLLWPPKPS